MLKFIRKLPLGVRMLIATFFGLMPFVLWNLLLGVGLRLSLGLYAICTVAGTVVGLRLHRREERNRGCVDPDPRPVPPLSMDDFGVHRGRPQERKAAVSRADRRLPAVPPLTRQALTISYRERRQENWDRTVVWARAHPRTASLIPWFFIAGIFAWACFAILDVIEGRWGAVAYYGPVIVLGVWTVRSWRRINRGEARPTIGRDR